MFEDLLIHGVQWACYGLEFSLFIYMLLKGQVRRLAGLCLYVIIFIVADGLGRPYILYRYGYLSHQYRLFYWLTDVVLTLAAFLLICSFFRRACANDRKTWHFLRFGLVLVFFMVLGVSLHSLWHNQSQLFNGTFMVGFQQDLYFACLVLTTLLYLIMQRSNGQDAQLSMLVSGMGIQYAGPAANFSLMYLMHGGSYTEPMLSYIMPICTFGMLMTWFYAVARLERSLDGGSPTTLSRIPALGDMIGRRFRQ